VYGLRYRLGPAYRADWWYAKPRQASSWPVKAFDERRRGELVIHRDGMVICCECAEPVEYEKLRHLDFYSDVQFAQCGPCADKNGEYCAVSQTRQPIRNTQPLPEARLP
jgi:hypothetical protein